MPILINIAANFLLGTLLVLILRRSTALHENFVNWALLVLLFFEALVFTPAITYLFRFYPQWSLHYCFDPQIFPEMENWLGWLSLLNVLLNFIAVMIAYIIARYGLIHNRLWPSMIPLMIGTALIALVAFIFGKRLLFIGEYDVFWHGQASVFYLSVPGWVGILLYLSVAVFLFLIYSLYSKHDPSF